MPSFNLVDQPWITCALLDGGRLEDLSLSEALRRAGEIREIADPVSPLVPVGVTRMMLALLHRVYGPVSVDAWDVIWRAGAWDLGSLGAYLGRWYGRFDLFDEAHPFYQVAGLDLDDVVVVSRLVHQMASGNNKTLFDHTFESACPSLTPAAAARYLVTHQAFALGGLVTPEKGKPATKYADAAPLARGAVMLVKGTSLFQTLLLNLHRYVPAEDEPIPCHEDDAPVWERDAGPVCGPRQPTGYLDWLTWQARRIRLLPMVDEAGQVTVSRVVLMNGARLPDGQWRRDYETMLAWTAMKKAKEGAEPWHHIGFTEDRALWRDSLAIVQSIGGQQERPRTVDWLSDLVAEGMIGRNVRLPLDLVGLTAAAAGAGSVRMWRHERLSVSPQLLGDTDVLDELRDALALAEEAGQQLREAAWTFARLVRFPMVESKDLSTKQKAIVNAGVRELAPERTYWGELEVPFRQLLDVLPTGDSAALAAWTDVIRRSAQAALARSISGARDGGRGDRARALAHIRLDSGLPRGLPRKQRG